MQIGILQTGHAAPEIREAQGDYDAMFRRLLSGQGLNFTTFNVVDGEFPESPQACDGWLITGSKHGAYEPYDWIAPLEALIRDAHAAAVPLVGICFGHQIIAQALGGKVEKFSGGWAVGPQRYDWQGAPVTLNAWHQDQVTTLPPGAEVLATNDHCTHAALLWPGRALTVQAHPEFTDAVTEGLIDYRGPGVVPAPQLAQARADLGTPLDQSRLAETIARFFLDPRAKP